MDKLNLKKCFYLDEIRLFVNITWSIMCASQSASLTHFAYKTVFANIKLKLEVLLHLLWIWSCENILEAA
jgi:hypothetical protein